MSGTVSSPWLTQAIATTVAAGIAFAGGLVGLAWKGWVDLRERRATLQHEVQVVRASLVAELRSMIAIVGNEIKYLQDHDFTWVPLLDFLSLYRTTLSTVSVLSVEEVSAISTAYYSYQEHIGYIARKSGLDLAKPYLGTNALFSFGDNEDEQRRKVDLVGDLNGILPAAEDALRILEDGVSAEQNRK